MRTIFIFIILVSCNFLTAQQMYGFLSIENSQDFSDMNWDLTVSAENTITASFEDISIFSTIRVTEQLDQLTLVNGLDLVEAGIQTDFWFLEELNLRSKTGRFIIQPEPLIGIGPGLSSLSLDSSGKGILDGQYFSIGWFPFSLALFAGQDAIADEGYVFATESNFLVGEFEFFQRVHMREDASQRYAAGLRYGIANTFLAFEVAYEDEFEKPWLYYLEIMYSQYISSMEIEAFAAYSYSDSALNETERKTLLLYTAGTLNYLSQWNRPLLRQEIIASISLSSFGGHSLSTGLVIFPEDGSLLTEFTGILAIKDNLELIVGIQKAFGKDDAFYTSIFSDKTLGSIALKASW
jgi:hypothetical protein